MDIIINKFKEIIEEHNLLKEQIEITCKPLTEEEAIGTPERKDFPLLKGKERLMEASFLGSFGQAYTDKFNNFYGTIEDVLSLSMKNNYERAVFISTLNAVLKHLNLIDKTRHCRNEGPEKCADFLVYNLKKAFKNPKIALIGLQPAMAEKLSEQFSIKIADLDPDNIGRTKFSTVIMDGEKDIKEILTWCDIALVTGTSAVNYSMNSILKMKEYTSIIFYGVTISGIAYILGLTRFCPEAF